MPLSQLAILTIIVEERQGVWEGLVRQCEHLVRQIRLAQEVAASHAKRLYTSAGVFPRQADWYVADMIDGQTVSARSRQTRPEFQDFPDTAMAALTFKVKKTGPDADRTSRAAALSRYDAAFMNANRALQQAADAYRAASIEADAFYRSRLATVLIERQHLLNDIAGSRAAQP